MDDQGGLNFLRLDSKTAKLDQLIEAAMEQLDIGKINVQDQNAGSIRQAVFSAKVTAHKPNSHTDSE